MVSEIVRNFANKKENFMETGCLGSLIREERLKKSLSQQQVGKKTGLTASRISKIEHGASIKPEVASFILDKIGSEVIISIRSSNTYDEAKSEFLLSSVVNFARANRLSLDRAYWYLFTFKGIAFLDEHYEIEQTLCFDEINSDLLSVCANNGGGI